MQRHGYWRWLSELEAIPPDGKSDGKSDGITRRDFLTLLGGSMALAGVGGCVRAPEERILPYSARPRIDRQGRPTSYATSFVLDGYAIGLLVESHAGRPTKVEGNPEHPASLGATGLIEQASVLELYDPARARPPCLSRRAARFEEIAPALASPRADAGAGLRLVMERPGSPLLADLLVRVLARAPRARVTFFRAVPDGALEGARRGWGKPFATFFDPAECAVTFAADSDFLASGPFCSRYGRRWGQRRAQRTAGVPGSRLYAAEAAVSPTGTVADHRLPLRSREIPHLVGSLVAELVLGQGLQPGGAPAQFTQALAKLRSDEGDRSAFLRLAAKDLAAARGASAVLAGPQQPWTAHVLAAVANRALENHGRTTFVAEPALLDLGEMEEPLPDLARDLGSGVVDTLVVLDCNLAYAAPADLGFGELVARVPNSVYLGLRDDETAAVCKAFLPAAHYLESWGDARALDGTISFVQPLIAPMHGGKSPCEVLAALSGDPTSSSHALLQELWRRRWAGSDFEARWDEALERGYVPESASKLLDPPIDWQQALEAVRSLGAPQPDETIDVAFRPDARVHDGRFVANAWLLELPEPVTRQSWGNAAILGPQTARRLGVDSGAVLDLEHGGNHLRAPALVLAGQAEGEIICHLGLGHSGAAGLARGVGFDANRLRRSDSPTLARGVHVTVTGEREQLALVQQTRSMHGRPIALAATVEQARRDPKLIERHRPRQTSFYPGRPLPAAKDQWAMAVDLSLCTGCSACVIACQSENNIPVVGKSQVLNNRWMHWLRVDAYDAEVGGRPVLVRQPMLCQHCEKAPCEYVCPVHATVHSDDGLNEMVYNRCVGTRYCSNNCPYKVRRFNFFDWNDRMEANRGSFELQKNPDVTVRERGVMEKCTYCVQRLREAGIEEQVRGEPGRALQVQTACQQACPTGAIVFGSLTAPGSKAAALHADSLCYGVLEDQGTRPRTRYLVKLVNANPEAP